MKKSNIIFASLVTIAFGFLLLQLSCSTASKIARYSGDGEIKAVSGGILQGGGGCILKFKPIKLNQSSQFSYHFKGLPNWHFNLFFVVEDSRWWVDQRWFEASQKPSEIAWAEAHNLKTKYANYDDVKGTLAMSLKDADGKIILQFNRPLSKLIWSGSGGGPPELYDANAVSFTPVKDVEYTLEISIDPDPALIDDEGYVLLRGGGHEGLSIGFQ